MRFRSPISNSSAIFTGHLSSQSPQATHLSVSTNFACSIILQRKFPGSPSIESTVVIVCRVIFGCLAHSLIFGDKIHIEQSLVGNVLSSWGILPPMVGLSSTRCTSNPISARSSDACIPAIPAPTTKTDLFFLPMNSSLDFHSIKTYLFWLC